MTKSLFIIQREALLSSSWPLHSITPHLTSFQKRISQVYGRTITTTYRRLKSTDRSASPKSCPRIEYMSLDEIEKPERYCPGGYHPISIGDHLSGRYDVVHKLGFGTYSTTWLAKDRTLEKYVAIKIATAGADIRERKILNTLAFSESAFSESAFSEPSSRLIPHVLDTFSLNGPNGKHQCLVTEPGMMTIAEAKDVSCTRIFRMPVARAIAAQVIQAVVLLHHRGIVHADLHPGNIMLHLPHSIDKLSPEQLYEKYGRPNLEPFERLDGKPLPDGIPSHGVVPIWLGKDSDLVSLSEAKVFITDFGESFLPSTPQRYYSNTPAVLAPPEIYFLLNEPLSFQSDIWTLACTLWDILGQRPLFEGFNPSSDWMIKEHVDALGKLPSGWWRTWDGRGRWFTEEGNRISEGAGRSLIDRFVDSIQEPRRGGTAEIAEDEMSALLAMVRGMLAFRPDERLTAREIMESEWVQRWALPCLEVA